MQTKLGDMSTLCVSVQVSAYSHSPGKGVRKASQTPPPSSSRAGIRVGYIKPHAPWRYINSGAGMQPGMLADLTVPAVR
jgi:hypothetical protein